MVKTSTHPKKRTPKASPHRKAPARKRPSSKTVSPEILVTGEAKSTVKRTYIFAVGRRKEAVARVRLFADGQGEIYVNSKPAGEYFPTFELQTIVQQPLVVVNQIQRGRVSAKVAGGGKQGQAEAVRLGIARALVQQDADQRIPLKRAGLLHRDPRVKERKKYGLKRARRAPQWQKR